MAEKPHAAREFEKHILPVRPRSAKHLPLERCGNPFRLCIPENPFFWVNACLDDFLPDPGIPLAGVISDFGKFWHAMLYACSVQKGTQPDLLT